VFASIEIAINSMAELRLLPHRQKKPGWSFKKREIIRLGE